MLASFLRFSNHISLIPTVMQKLYIAFRPRNDLVETAALTAMESSIADISRWMHTDIKLKLNSDKTECLLIGTCSCVFYHLNNKHRIRKSLNHPVAESLVHAFTTCRIDYCNSLLYGLANPHIMKLQRIQNAAARLVTGTPRFCHVTPLLFHLHWLPISYRVMFKILLLTFKCLYSLAPNKFII